jgi:glycosyltransferase involved in cell wall biosynthesis
MPFVVADAGMIVGENDDVGWRDAIDQLAVDGPCRRAYAQRGLSRARERYSWPLVARRHLAFFDEVRRS